MSVLFAQEIKYLYSGFKFCRSIIISVNLYFLSCSCTRLHLVFFLNYALERFYTLSREILLGCNLFAADAT